MKLSKLLKNKNVLNYSIDNLQDHSDNVNSKSIFFAIKGKNYNGADYIDECIKKSCKTIITNDYNAYLKYKLKYKKINILYYKNINKTKALIAKRFYKDITRKIYLIGITGTNGKTSTTTLVYKYLRSNNINACLIGTNGVYINEDYYEEENTSPDILKLYKYFSKANEKNIKYIIMEVSSHAIKLNRILGLKYKIKALTNISHDHLDFHKTFENYKKTKENWLKQDKFTKIIIKKSNFEKINFFEWVIYKKKISERQFWDKIYIKKLNFSENGTEFEVFSNKYGSYGTHKTNMIGDFNLENINLFLCIINSIKKFNIFKLKNFFKNKIIIDGRLNFYKINNKKVIIDFCHSPDGIEKVLDLFNNLNKRIISVCGCGGERDKQKRAKIGEILSKKSYISVFTSDNPRSEDPLNIINEMKTNVSDNVYEVVSRKDAIKKAFELSDSNDYILILGKGNEKKQIFKDYVIYKSDCEILEEVVSELYE